MAESIFRLPGYVIEQPLGDGANARVWRARVRTSGDRVAVKVLAIHDRDERAAALAEAALLKGLDHPHLIHLHEALPCGQGLALVLDLAAGGTLDALLRARGRLTPGEVVTALAPIGAALAYAHTAGVVHGDVSAANVLFTDAGLPLLADLGVSRLIGDALPPVRSTPAYVDPAVAGGGLPSPATDVFMLAALALHALTGAPLWQEAEPGEAYARAARGELGDITGRLRSAGVPDAVTAVLERALQTDPARRCTAAEFALDLRHAADPVAVELSAGRAGEGRPARAALTYGHRVAPPASTPAWTWRPDSPARLVRLGAVAAVLAAIAGLLWLARQNGGGLARARPLSPSHAVDPMSAVRGREVPADASGSAPAPARLDAASAARVLRGLDIVRARAYAERRPSLLAAVYAPGPLLSQDAGQLQSIVPAGCGMYGASTTFSHVAVTSRAADGVQLRVRAALAAATLECGGEPAGTAPAQPARTLRIGLTRSGAGYLIDSVSR